MIKRLIFAISLFGLCWLAAPAPTLAKDVVSGVDCSNAEQAKTAVCQDKVETGGNLDENNPISGKNGILMKATNIVAFVAGAAAVILLIVGGLRFVTSGGDSGKVASARGTIMNAIIGLIIIVLARYLIEFVLGKV